ncbi:hypothetical protein Krodi_2901 [Dokdonia sp. 4H-3-7-5]|nr:hypothetical protein Krodi_2901 [Dokdonia sp. 4H-3-7-5]
MDPKTDLLSKSKDKDAFMVLKSTEAVCGDIS